MKIRLLFAAVALLGSAALAQDEDAVSLSAFEISGGEAGYILPKPQPAKPEVAITIRKPATAVVMEVNLVNANDKPEARNREIYATITALEQAVRRVPEFSFERREIQLRGDARKSSFMTRGGSVVSSAVCAIVAPLSADADVFALVQKMRATVAGVSAVGATKVLDGSAGLVLEHPEQYRPEILKKIFEDLGVVKSGLGADFEVLPSGLAGPVRTRAASEKEVELWIDYGFSIRSVLQLKNPGKA